MTISTLTRVAAAQRLFAGYLAAASTSSRNFLRGGSRGPETGVRGIPSPFINLDERGRDTPHPSLLPLLPPRKDLFAGLLAVRVLWRLADESKRRARTRLRARGCSASRKSWSGPGSSLPVRCSGSRW